jgi:hypothetical protein
MSASCPVSTTWGGVRIVQPRDDEDLGRELRTTQVRVHGEARCPAPRSDRGERLMAAVALADPGPLKYRDGDGWVPLTEDDSRAFVGMHQWSLPKQVHPLWVDGRYVFVRNNAGTYDRWRGAGHPPFGEPYA